MTGSAYTKYTELMFKYNLTGAGSDDTETIPTMNLSKNGDNYIVTYSILNDKSDFSNFSDPYYGVLSEEEQTLISSNSNEYNPLIQSRISEILATSNPNDYRMLFSDVANITFDNTDTNDNSTFDSGEDVGTLTFGQLNGTYSRFDPKIPAQVKVFPDNPPTVNPNDPNVIVTAQKHGDVWFNTQNSQWSHAAFKNISKGDYTYKVILEEISHSLGVDIVENASKASGTIPDNQKYTVTSYQRAPDLEDSTLIETGFEVSAYTLQLYDIAALQEIYGRNYDKQDGSGTVWNVSSMNYSNDLDDAFLYTIWDGGGLSDTIDASELDNYFFTESVEIDLRQGRFSSIGENIYGNAILKDAQAPVDGSDPDPGNVAIAFHTVIENAIGTNLGDILIGNAWNNKLEGRIGDDYLYGDGVVSADGDAGFHDVDLLHPDNDQDTTNDTNTYIAAAADDSGNDHLLGGAGDDHLYGGAGRDILDGGTGEDKLYGGTNDALSTDFELDVADYSTLNEAVTITKLANGNAFDFTVTGKTSNEVDHLKEIELIKGTSGSDTIDLQNINQADYKIFGGKLNPVIQFDDGLGGTKPYQFQDFENIVLNNQDNVIQTDGIGNMTIDGGAGNNAVSFSSFYNKGSIAGEGLYVTQSGITRTVNNTNFENFQEFKGVNYAHIEALGHTYSDVQALDYSDYSNALTFAFDELITFDSQNSIKSASIYETGAPSGLQDDVSFRSHYIIGTNHGDTLIAPNGRLSGFYSGTGNDVVDAHIDNYFYTGGNDNLSSAYIEKLILPSSVTQADLSYSIVNANNAIGKAITVNIAGYGSVAGKTFYDIVTYDSSGNSIQIDVKLTGNSTSNYSVSEFVGTPRGGESASQLDDVSNGGITRGLGGDDTLTLSDGSSKWLYGDLGDDTLTGNVFSNRIFGGVGDDTLNGLSGNDTLEGGRGNDVIDGGAGSDDHAVYSNNTSAVHVDLSVTNAANVDENYDGTTATHLETLTNVENVTGTVFDDTFIGDLHDNEFHGLNGDDTYTGNDGADTFYIGNGLDTILDFKTIDGDKVSVEHALVDGFDDISISYTQLATETLAHVYLNGTGEKVADIHLDQGLTLSASDFLYESYKTPENPAPGNNAPTTNPISGDLEFTNNYNPRHYFSTVIKNTGDYSGLNLKDSDLAYLEQGIDSGVTSGFIWFGKPYITPNYAYVTPDTIRVRMQSGDAYTQAIYGSGNAGEYDANGNDLNPNGSTSSASVPIPNARGNGNDSNFVYNANLKTTSQTDHVYEDVNAGTDKVIITNADANDVYFSLNSSGDLLINFDGFPNYKIQIDATNHGSHGSDAVKRIEQIILLSNSSEEIIDISNGLDLSGTDTTADNLFGTVMHDVLNGGAMNDTLYGRDGDDTLIGGTGNDTLNGDAGNDAYVWSVGDGNDTINETGGTDQLVLHNVLESELRFEKIGNYSLKVHVGDESVLMQYQLYSDYQNNSSYDTYQVETLLLDDGTILDLTGGLTFTGSSNGDTLHGLKNYDDVLDGEAGNDTLYADGGDDTLIGGTGNDTLNGGSGNDTYVWSVGDGNDTINETGGADQLVLHNVLESELRFEKIGNYSLKVHVGNESVLMQYQLYSDYQNNSSLDTYQIETLLLDDGTTVDLTGGLTFTGSSNVDTLHGLRNYDDVLDGNAGNDTLYAYGGNDTLIGGTGNDTLNGDAGNDTYVWSVGDGNDTVTETDGTDQLVLHNVLESELRFEKLNTYNLKIHVDNESITINSQFQSDFQSNNYYDYLRVETLLLDDGTTIDLTGGLTFTGSSNGDTIYGQKNQDDHLLGDAGNDNLYAGGGDDTLAGGTGNDGLNGEAGNDTYVWSVGDGNDTIIETAGTDQLVLHNVLESELRFEKFNTYNLKIHVNSEELTLQSQFQSDYQNNHYYDYLQVESILLDDGTTIDLTAGLTFTGTANNDTVHGLQNEDSVLYGLDGLDYLYANNGNDTLNGGGGTDYLYGGNGDDVLSGGDGIDLLYGQSGADIFLFEAIGASDNIQDFKLSQNDKFDVSDLLQGYDAVTDAITDFVQITESGSNSYLSVDVDGGADNFVQIAYIYNETGLTDEDALETSGNLITV